jgi:hypothetical protein
MRFNIKNSNRRFALGTDHFIIDRLSQKLKVLNRIDLSEIWSKRNDLLLATDDIQVLAAAIREIMIEIIQYIKESPLPRFTNSVFLGHKIAASHIYD